MNNKIQQLTFNRDSYSDVLEVTDELAALEQRKPHDSIRLLILEAGRAKIDKLRSGNPTPENKDTDSQSGSQ
ncbi:hypothetical protein LCGC14_0362250 [marine sediment metagenome]|uniref:Uncharacterized protein n=1 Tax=marine sediment metagenome TaxID=412755 RepID=A0A0F9TQL4_9ZZZZ